jgi:hypothetical protein
VSGRDARVGCGEGRAPGSGSVGKTARVRVLSALQVVHTCRHGETNEPKKIK